MSPSRLQEARWPAGRPHPQEEAKRQGKSLSVFVREALERHLDEAN
ncbi:MAG: ribbon-helix-helix protein, CopG family [Acidobacteriota bacterium]|nr:ribbon-helix-helix protein, CopG family [Acidobacteriota bacterium]